MTFIVWSIDFALYLENPVTAANILNDDFGRMHSWADDWLVGFNPSKTESRKRNKPHQLLMDITVLNEG